MPIISLTLISFAVLTVYSSIGNLYIGLRKGRDPLFMIFSVMGFILVEVIIANVLLLNSFSTEGIVLAARLRIAGVSVFIALFVWFVALYTGYRPKIALIIFSTEVLLLMTVRLAHPSLLGFDAIHPPAVHVLPWGERVSVFVSVSNRWMLLYVLNGIIALVFTYFAAAIQYRRGGRNRALGLMAAMLALTLLTLYDMFSGLTGMGKILVNDLGWFSLVILLNAIFTEDGLRAGIIRKSLQESERTFRALFESAFEYIALLDPGGRIVDINASAVEASGRPKSEIINRYLWDVFIFENIRKESEGLIDVITRAAAGETQRLEGRFMGGNGVVRIVDMSIRRISGEGGDARYLLTEGRDITELVSSRWRIIAQNEELTGLNRDLFAANQELEITNREFEALNLDLLRSEKELRESELRLKAIIEHSTGLFYSHGIDDVYTYVSPQSRTFFDCEPGECMVRWQEFLSDNPENAVGDIITRRAMESGEPQAPYTLEIRTRKGRTKWVEVHESPVVVDGRTVMMVGVLTDITDRKNAEDLLRVQRDLGIALDEKSTMQDAIEVILKAATGINGIDCGGFYLVRQDGERLELVAHSNLTEGFVGKTSSFAADSLQGSILLCGRSIFAPIRDVFQPADEWPSSGEMVGFGMVPVLHSGRTMGSLVVASKTSEYIPVAARHTLEAISSRIGIVLSRLQAVEALKESESRFKDLAELLPQPIFETDATGICTYANEYAFRLFGYERQILPTGTSVLDLILPEERESAIRNMMTVTTTGITGHEYTAMRKDGTLFPVAIHATIFKKDGAFAGFRGTVIDLTEIKRAENEIRQSLREKDTLLREIHHRVRNNLQLIVGLLNLETFRHEEGSVRGAYQEILSRVRSLALIHEKVYRSSDFSRIDMEPFVKELVDELVGIYSLDRKKLVCSIGAAGIFLDVERALPCAMLIAEILSNAFVHGWGDDGKCTVTVQFTRNEDTFQLIIADGGRGMNRDLLANPGAKTLGLQLISSLTQQLNADLLLDTSKGTSYRIEFQSGKPSEPGGERVQPKAKKAPAGGGSILIVEDEMITALYMKRVLERAGFTVADVIISGETAVEKIKDINPSLIFMDIQLAGDMNGIEASRRIWTKSPVPIVFLSANTDQLIIKAVDAMKAEHPCSYVVKPVDPGILVSEAKRHVERQI